MTDTAMAPSPAETAPNLIGFGKGSIVLVEAAFLCLRFDVIFTFTN